MSLASERASRMGIFILLLSVSKLRLFSEVNTRIFGVFGGFNSSPLLNGLK